MNIKKFNIIILTMTLGVLSLISCSNDVNPGYFVALTDNKTAAYSTNGIDWTTVELPFSANWLSISYGLDSDIFGFL